MSTQFKKTVSSKIPWEGMGINIVGPCTISVVADDSTWTANPATGMYDANGAGIPAKDGYCVVQGTEGALVGCINRTFLFTNLGKNGLMEMAGGLSGELFLSINDDIKGDHGAGFSDNKGSINVTITINP